MPVHVAMIVGLSLFSYQKSIVPLVRLALQRYSFFMRWQKMERRVFVRGRTSAAMGDKCPHVIDINSNSNPAAKQS